MAEAATKLPVKAEATPATQPTKAVEMRSCPLQLRMAEEELHSAQVASLAIDLCSLRASHRVRAVKRETPNDGAPGAKRPPVKTQWSFNHISY